MTGIVLVCVSLFLLCTAGVFALIGGIAASGRNFRASILMISICAGLTLIAGYLVGRAEVDFKIKMEAGSVRK
jgi:hypothetical protein